MEANMVSVPAQMIGSGGRSVTGPAGEETLVAAIDRLRGDGYQTDYFATNDGRLGCRDCGETLDPADMQLAQRVRFEGSSNPSDEAVLLALICACGHRGLYSAAYGPSTPPDDSAVLTRFARRHIDA